MILYLIAKHCLTNYFIMFYNFCMKEEQKKEKIKKQSATKGKKVSDESKSSVVQNVRVDTGSEVVASIKKNQIDAYDELETYKKLVKKRRNRLATRIIAFFVLLIIAPFLIFLTTVVIDKDGKHDFFGRTFYIVVSPSMEPEIKVNDCVVLKNVTSKEELKIGDDIGYFDVHGNVIVHRIVDIKNEGTDNVKYVTGGINNPTYDQLEVSFDSVVGVKIANLRVLGNLVVFFRSGVGIAVFVTVFLAIVVGFYFAFRATENITYVDDIN